METPTKGEDIKSHQVSGLSEELTPANSSAVPSGTATEQTAPQQEGRGGVTEYLKSWIGGGSGNAETAPHPDQKTTHTQELKDGSTAAIHTAPESSAVPTSLQESPHTVGSARTEFQQPVSEYASALEGIAGEPVAHDPSAKYAPALGALTGDAPPSGQGTGVVGAVTAAAGNVYHGVAQAVGYEDSPATNTSTGATSATGTTAPGTTGSQRTVPDYETSGTGSGTGIGSAGATGAQGVGTGGSAVTPADLPKSGVVDTSSGTADITAKEQPGYLASAAGTVSNAAAGLKDRVAGIYGGSGETGSAAGTGEGFTKPGVEYEDEAPGAGAGAAAGVGSAAAAKEVPSSTTTTGPSSTTAAGPSTSTAAPTSDTAGVTPPTTAAPATTGASSESTKAPTATTAGASSSTADPSTASETTKAAPAQAKEAVTSGTTAPTTTTEPTKEASAAKPTVSAFAADSKSPSKDTKAGEITEEAGVKKAAVDKEKAAAGAVKGSEAKTGTTGAATATETKAGSEAAKKEEKKAQSKCCGVCSIQ